MIEADNLPSDHTKAPITDPVFSNFTFVGQAHDSGILMRRGVASRVVNGIVVDDTCLDIDDTATTQQGLAFQSIMLDCTTDFADDTSVTAAEAAAIFNAGANNTVDVSNTLTGTFVNGSAENGRTAVDPSTLNTVLDSVSYIGAVQNSSDTWWQDWTCGLGSPTPAC